MKHFHQTQTWNGIDQNNRGLILNYIRFPGDQIYMQKFFTIIEKNEVKYVMLYSVKQ